MALIVEDGTGLVNADSYVSVDDADTYHAALGDSAWTGSSTAKEQALRQAAVYLDGKYGPLFRGDRTRREQALKWPRTGAVDDDGFEFDSSGAAAIPKKLRDAAAEVALESIKGTALFVTETTPAGVKAESIKVGGIEIAEEFAGPKSQQPKFAKVEALLADLIDSGVRRVRA